MKLADATVTCPACGHQLTVPIHATTAPFQAGDAAVRMDLHVGRPEHLCPGPPGPGLPKPAAA